MIRLPLPAQTAGARSKQLTAERLINLYAEQAPRGAKGEFALYGTPGQKTFATLVAGPIRGMEKGGNSLFVVSGSRVYLVDAAGNATDLGSVSANDEVYMAWSGAEMAIAAGGFGYIATTTALNQITDPDFPTVDTVTWIDGYFVWTTRDTDQFIISAINDGTDYDPLDFASAESNPDNLVRCFVDHREVWLFGEESTEVWYNSGAADFPFDRIPGAVIEKGCSSPQSVAAGDNTLCWVGNDQIVYRAEGYRPQRISTHAVEKDLKGKTDIRAFTYADEGHTFYVLNIPGVRTWVYDFATQLWHERKTQGQNDWDPAFGVHIWNKILVGKDSALSELDLETYDELGAEITRELVTPPYGGVDWMTLSSFQLDMETGVGLTTGQGSDPQAMLQWSSDNGKTWSYELWRSFGAIGAYGKRVIWRRLGRFLGARTFKVSISDPIKVAIVAGWIDG